MYSYKSLFTSLKVICNSPCQNLCLNY